MRVGTGDGVRRGVGGNHKMHWLLFLHLRHPIYGILGSLVCINVCKFKKKWKNEVAQGCTHRNKFFARTNRNARRRNQDLGERAISLSVFPLFGICVAAIPFFSSLW